MVAVEITRLGDLSGRVLLCYNEVNNKNCRRDRDAVGRSERALSE